MKKTILAIITVVMLVAVVLTTRVNAASVNVDKTKIEKGDIITVTIKTNEKVESMEFTLKFDATKYEFVTGSVKTDLSTVADNIKNGNELIVSAFDTNTTTDTLTLQFKALEKGENIPFEISDTEFSNDEEMTNSTVKVTVVEKQETDKTDTNTTTDDTTKEDTNTTTDDTTKEDTNTTTENTTTDNTNTATEDTTKQEENSEKTSNSNVYVDEDGNKITKLPQAGSLVPSIALGITILGMAIVVGYKMIKNK